MESQLVLVEGGKTVVVRPRLPSVIGRGHAADLKVPDSKTSRRHCELYEYEGQLAVRDLGSVNGTVVNGHRIDQDTLLSTGDTLTIGNVTFRVDVGEPDADGLPPNADAGDQAAEATGDVVTIPQDAEQSAVHSESADVEYQSSEGGSFIGVIEQAEGGGEESAEGGDEDDDDDGLSDFLSSLK